MDLAENERKTPIIIIDEAHLLDKEMLEEMRFLLNFRMDSYNPLSLILVGQPEFKRVLQLQVYEAIAQRVNLRYHLPPMDRQESKEYVCHHLKVAAVTSSIFTMMPWMLSINIPEALQKDKQCLPCLSAFGISQSKAFDR